MDLNGENIIPASRQKVWEALNNIEILKNCIPGCESITQVSETELEARVIAKVGPVKAKFNGHVTLSELDPPNGYKISGEGKGGVAGFAKGSATVVLSEYTEGTILRYSVNASVGGKLAQIGNRLIEATAKKMAEQFFQKFTLYAVTGVTDQDPAISGELNNRKELETSNRNAFKTSLQTYLVTKIRANKRKSLTILVGTATLALISFIILKM